MHKVTLGGDRLGAGKRMQVELHNYERSTHDLSKIWRSTMSAGTLVPFMSEVALPGDTFDIDLQCEILTHPTIGPLFGSFKAQLDVFLVPMRLYNSYLHNNKLEIGLDMSKIKIPQIELTAWPLPEGFDGDIDNSQINPSCIMSYLGIRGVGIVGGETKQSRLFNAIPFLAYWDIYKQYYANKQEEVGAVIRRTPTVATAQTVDDVEIGSSTIGLQALPEAPAVSAYEIGQLGVIRLNFTGTAPDPRQVMVNLQRNGLVSFYDLVGGNFSTGGSDLQGNYNWYRYGDDVGINWSYLTNYQPITVSPEIFTFPLTNIDNMRSAILAYDNETVPFTIEQDGSAIPYGGLQLTTGGAEGNYMINSQEGLAIKTYLSDLFNNWLRDEYVTLVNNISSVSTAGDSFTIDSLRLAEKTNNLLNRIMVSGGTYNDWIDTVYGEKTLRKAESPMYMGGLQKELVFQEVINNSGSEAQPLGTLAGRGKLTGGKGGNVVIRVDEPSYIIGIVSLTPRIDYSQGNKWDTGLESFDDLHKPALDEIGFQDLITEQMAWWDTTNNTVAWLQNSAGKQPAWINYMTNINETRGNFAIASNEMFMTLNRRYEWEEGTGIVDLTTYIDPTKFNFIFAETALDAQNFWTQIGVNMKVRRKMSAKIMPNL